MAYPREKWPTSARAVPCQWQSDGATPLRIHILCQQTGLSFLRISTLRYSSITSTMLRRYLMNVRYVTNVSAQAIRSHLQEAGLHSRNTIEFP